MKSLNLIIALLDMEYNLLHDGRDGNAGSGHTYQTELQASVWLWAKSKIESIAANARLNL